MGLTEKTIRLLNQEELWQEICQEVKEVAQKEPLLASFVHLTVLHHQNLNDVLAFHLSSKLASSVMDARSLQSLFHEALDDEPAISEAMTADILAYYQRDPACDFYSLPLLYFKGFHATQSYRITHWLWQQDRHALAYFLQNRISEVMGVDIHPAAKIGRGIMIDHGTGVVVGETAVVGDDVSMLHGVTLGGSGKAGGDRHPKIGNGVMIGAHAAILGNIRVGECAKVGAGSVVLEDVPERTTVAGVPAKIVGATKDEMPSISMDQSV